MPGDGATRSSDTCQCVSVFCTWWWRLSHPPHGPTAHPGKAIFHSAQSPLLTELIVPHCSGGSGIHLCGGKAVLCMCHPHNISKNVGGVSAVTRAFSSTSSVTIPTTIPTSGACIMADLCHILEKELGADIVKVMKDENISGQDFLDLMEIK